MLALLINIDEHCYWADRFVLLTVHLALWTYWLYLPDLEEYARLFRLGPPELRFDTPTSHGQGFVTAAE
jgi:hypothetical protein